MHHADRVIVSHAVLGYFTCSNKSEPVQANTAGNLINTMKPILHPQFCAESGSEYMCSD